MIWSLIQCDVPTFILSSPGNRAPSFPFGTLSSLIPSLLHFCEADIAAGCRNKDVIQT